MALRPIVDTLEGLDEGIAGLYVEEEAEDGTKTYRLDVEASGGWELADTRGLKKALEAERARAKGKADESEEVEALKARLAELESKSKEQKKATTKQLDEQAQAKIDELVRLHEQKQTAWEAEKADLEKDLHGVLIETKAREALRAGGFKEAERAVYNELARDLRMGRDAQTGKRIVEVVDSKTGNPRVGDAQGNPMTVEGRVKEFLEDSYWKKFADGAGATGGGLNGGGTETVSKAGKPDTSKLDPIERLKLANREAAAASGS